MLGAEEISAQVGLLRHSALCCKVGAIEITYEFDKKKEGFS